MERLQGGIVVLEVQKLIENFSLIVQAFTDHVKLCANVRESNYSRNQDHAALRLLELRF